MALAATAQLGRLSFHPRILQIDSEKTFFVYWEKFLSVISLGDILEFVGLM